MMYSIITSVDDKGLRNEIMKGKSTNGCELRILNCIWQQICIVIIIISYEDLHWMKCLKYSLDFWSVQI